MTISHCYQVPFAEAGHAINMLNVASILATPELHVHVLVLSRKNTQRWLKATGQATNPHVVIHPLADGKWEDWEWTKASEIVGMLFTKEWIEAVDAEITRLKEQYPGDKHNSVTINPLMSGLLPIAAKQSLKMFVLNPTAYFGGRLDGAVKLDGSSKPTDEFTYQGIAGSNKEMCAILGDVIEFFGPMAQMTKPTLDAASGIILSNTNLALEGADYQQPNMPDKNAYRLKTQKTYFIGPILPPSFEHALDDSASLQERLNQAPKEDPCIQFLDKHDPKSVVYITLGSIAQFTHEQAVLVIEELRKYSIPWIMLYRKDRAKLESAIGDHPDGLIADWAPQLDMMLHPSTKCVLAHGGFGTMIEGVYAGQAFICTPIMSDQFIDTRVMLHLGISLGNLAVNRFESVMGRSEIVPYWPDDGGKTLRDVFEKAFGQGGEESLQRARNASQALRAKMVKERSTSGVVATQALRKDLS